MCSLFPVLVLKKVRTIKRTIKQEQLNKEEQLKRKKNVLISSKPLRSGSRMDRKEKGKLGRQVDVQAPGLHLY